MDDQAFPDGLNWLSEDSPCVCGNMFCVNIWTRQTLVRPTHSTIEDELEMHAALKSQDCARVCDLLESGMQLCTDSGHKNCFTYILKYWKHPFLRIALQLHPSAVNCQGPGGDSLLMLCRDRMKMKTLLSFSPDVSAKNEVRDNILHHAVKTCIVECFDRMSQMAYRILGEGHKILAFSSQTIKMEAILWQYEELIEVIVTCGVDINSVDKQNKTAVETVLDYFECSYSNIRLHIPCNFYQNLQHNDFLCDLGNQLITFTMNKLMKSNAKLPPPDKTGRTALMITSQSPCSWSCLESLIQRGADVQAKDNDGFNAIYYSLKSFASHCDIYSCDPCSDMSDDVDETISMLLDYGCQMQGLDITVNSIWEMKCRVVVYLMSLRDSCLNRRNFPRKLEVKNDPGCYLSFINIFLEYRDHPYYVYEMNDLAVIEQEIASGLKTNQVDEGLAENLQVTAALSNILGVMTCEPLSMERLDEDVEYYETAEGILRLLLRFWPNPPLSLILTQFYRPGDDEVDVIVHRRLFEALFDVGGPLPPGSKLYIATKKRLESAARENPFSYAEGGILEQFIELHAEVPTLQHLCRTALRSSFSLEATDTTGLDLSSLRVKWFGTVLPLPQLIRNFINYYPLTYRP